MTAKTAGGTGIVHKSSYPPRCTKEIASIPTRPTHPPIHLLKISSLTAMRGSKSYLEGCVGSWWTQRRHEQQGNKNYTSPAEKNPQVCQSGHINSSEGSIAGQREGHNNTMQRVTLGRPHMASSDKRTGADRGNVYRHQKSHCACGGHRGCVRKRLFRRCRVRVLTPQQARSTYHYAFRHVGGKTRNIFTHSVLEWGRSRNCSPL